MRSLRSLRALRPLLVCLLAACPVLAPAQAQAQTQVQAQATYSVSIVAGRGGALAINAAGDLAGFTWAADGNARAFRHADGVLTVLGTMGGYASQATGINDAGTLAGSVGIWETGGRGFTYADGAMSDLGTLGGNYVEAAAINNAGVVAGLAHRADGQSRAFRHANGVMQELGTLSTAARGGSVARAINNAGQIAGASFIGDLDVSVAPTHAFLYEDGVMRDLGAFAGNDSAAYGINDHGDVVGVSAVGGGSAGSHAFLYRDGVMGDLGALPGGDYAWARDINNAGLVVGDSNSRYAQHGFVYSAGMMIDLNNLIDRGSGWEIITAAAINDQHQIAATACRGDGCYPVRLDLTGSALPVPEPAAYLMLLGGLGSMGVVGLFRRRRASGRVVECDALPAGHERIDFHC